MEIAKGRKSVKQLAQEELHAEMEKKAVKQLKDKYKELKTAQLVVRNIERDIEDLEAELAEEMA